MTDLLEIGDKVVVENGLTKSVYVITRVTKTQALSKRESDGYEHRFYRDTKKKGVAYHKSRFDQNTYRIIKAKRREKSARYTK